MLKESIKDLIVAIAEGDSIAIEDNFNSVMASKISDRLGTMRVAVAQNMFGGQVVEESVELNATKEHISHALKDSDSLVRQAAIQHPNATKEHISHALKDSDIFVRMEAIRHPNATKEHISHALKDNAWYVRQAAIQHPNATKEHISHALKDDDKDVREAAIRHPNATAEHITHALNDKAWRVREAAIQHPNATAEHITHALKDNDEDIRKAAIQHPNATKEHISHALKDSDSKVRSTAKRLNKLKKIKVNEELTLEDFSIEELEEFMMSEEFEQLDELSKQTLGSYIKKAAGGVKGAASQAMMAAHNPNGGHFSKAVKRVKGIEKATDKLTKEELEELDEISSKTLDSYREKAFSDNRPEKQNKRKEGRLLAFDKQVLSHLVKVPANKLTKEELESIEEARRGTFRAGSKSYFKAGQSAIKNIQRAAQERKEKEHQEKEQVEKSKVED